jgi:hypothetical protein
MRQQVEQRRGWLEQLAESVAGRKIAVTTVRGSVGAPPASALAATAASADKPVAPKAPVAPSAPVAPNAPDLKARAMADDGVQALLDVFPAEIRDVEEIK